MVKLNRRKFLYSSAVIGGGFTLTSLLARSLFGPDVALVAGKDAGGYGPLSPVKSSNTGETLLALPEGFNYTVFGRTGTPMSDRHPTPPAHDGMAAFAVQGKIRLVRNHEIRNQVGTTPAALGQSPAAYDPLAGGGTTTLIIDPKTRVLVRDFVSLSGTLGNCAGGPTPWGSWISCEETTNGKTKGTDRQGRPFGGYGQSHGYCFEVPAKADGPVEAVPLREMGRFVHEAVAVDPATGIVYETEDAGQSGFYRFIPRKAGKLAQGGQLEMLAIKGRPNFDTRTGQRTGQSLTTTWVPIADPDPVGADLDSGAVFRQGHAKGGAIFARLEGCWYGRGRIYFTATSGGNAKIGQIWEYRPSGKSEGTLTLLFESPDTSLMEMPDNICVSPRGGLVICEDGKDHQYIRGLTPQGQVFDFARNIAPGYETSELAGATYSPDGQTLFVNAQRPGVTMAIWGPWRGGVL